MMSKSSPVKKIIDLRANTTTPHGATVKLTVEYRIRPQSPTEPGPIYEHVKVHKHVDVNIGSNDQYKQQANYTYGSETDLTQKYLPYERTHDGTQTHIVSKNFNTSDDIYVPEQIIEHISEDEKSTSSEEVVFEEWTEEFTCRRTDEYDGRTNRLLRTTIDETGDRIKGDVIKEEYKGKNTRIKGHKSYDVVKEVYRRAPTHVYEEIPQPPPLPISKDRQWTSEEIYTTEIVSDPNLAKELESTAQKFDSLSHYYDDKQKQDQEDVVTEEYEVEFETPIKREDISNENLIDQKYSTKGDTDWRNKLKQIYHPPSDDDQHKNQINGNYVAQRASVVPSNTQQRFKEVQVKVPGYDRTPPEQRKFQPSSPSRHTVKEVLVCVSKGSSNDETEQKRKRIFFADYETPKKLSPIDNDYLQSPKRSSSSSSIVNERRTQYESIDRPIYTRVGELKSTFESTTNESIKDETSKYKTSITPGLTEQRRRVFEEQEWARRPINDFNSNERRMSETHTAPSIVSDRISRIESSITKPISQTSIDIKYRNKQVISSIDSDFSGPTKPIYQSTPKSNKQKYDDDAGHESEDELSDPRQISDTRRRTSKTRLRDFSQSTSQPIDTTHAVQRTVSKFDETNMENILSHVPTSKGKGILIELSQNSLQSPTKSNVLSDSGVFDFSTTTSHQIPIRSPSWRDNYSTSVINDTNRSRDNGVYIDSTITTSPYVRRQISNTDQNVDDSIARSTYKYNREIIPNQQYPQQQRTVRRQLTNSPPTDYEVLTNYRSRINTQNKVPITTQSRSIKPIIVDEFETVETETRVECNVQRTNEVKETTITERTVSPSSPSKKILITTRITDETTPSKRVLLNEKPQYYESTKVETQFQPIEHNRSQDNLPYNSSPRSYTTSSHKMEVTSLSPTSQITFDKHSPNQIVARIRHGISESNIYEKPRQEEERPRLHYQRVHATSYRPPLITPDYQQRESRSRIGPIESTNDYSSPINIPVRSASYHTTLHEKTQQPQQQQQRYQPRYHSGSCGNLFGSNLDFEIEIEKRPPQQPEQPTRISLDQSSRAIVTTSKDGRVSIQNVAAYPGNTIVINSDYHSSDRSLNRSSGYFSSDEPRSQGHTTNYSSDEQSSGANQYSPSVKYNQINDQTPTRYHFDKVNGIVKSYSQTAGNFNETINQIDGLYNSLNIQTNDQRPYDFSKLNRRRQLTQNPDEYSKRYTSTCFQHIPYEQQPTSDNNNQNWNSSTSLNTLVTSTPIRPSHSLSSSGILADYGTPGSISPNSPYSSTQYQNRLNGQSQIGQRNRTSVKQVKQKNAAKKRNTQGQYSDEDDDSHLSDYERSQAASRVYNFNNHHQ